MVIGGGVMGSALAYWLTRLEPSIGATVVERDPSYGQASSALSAASIRQQFSTPVNIRASQASIAFLRNAAVELAVGDETPNIMLREAGYLYLAMPDGAAGLRQAHAVQIACGADIALMDSAELRKRFGWLNTSDLSLGSLGLSGEGWFDGYALLTAFARKARAAGRTLRECGGVRVRRRGHPRHRSARGRRLADSLHTRGQCRGPVGTARRRHGRSGSAGVCAAAHRLRHFLSHSDEPVSRC